MEPQWEGLAAVTAPASTPSSSRSPLIVITQQHHVHITHFTDLSDVCAQSVP